MLFDKNIFQLGEWIAIYMFYINLTRLAGRERKLSVSKHLAVASSGVVTDQSWAFQTALSNPSYRSSMSPLLPNLYPDSSVSASYFSLFYHHTSTWRREASILQSECLFCISYAGNTICEAPKHYFRGTYLSCRWNYETVFVWEFLLLRRINQELFYQWVQNQPFTHNGDVTLHWQLLSQLEPDLFKKNQPPTHPPT